MWNILFGILFIAGGLSGRFSLIFTNSPTALTIVGVVLLVWGIVQVAGSRKES